MKDKWIDASNTLPKKSGIYAVKYSGYSDDVCNYERGFLGLSWLSYWSDEKRGLRMVTHWREIT